MGRIDQPLEPLSADLFETPAADVPRLAIDPFDERFLADPYAHHHVLRETGAVVWLDAYNVYASAHYAEVSTALNDWQHFVSGRGVGLADFAVEAPWRPKSLLLETDPPVHDRTRKLMNRILSLSRIKALAADWQLEADLLVDELLARGSFDAVESLAQEFPLRVFPRTIGLMDGVREHLLDYAELGFNAFGPRNAVFQRSADRARDAIEWVNQACRRENLTPGGWGLDLYHAADEGQCTEEEAFLLVRSLIAAGVDTTVNGLANMLNAFVHHPDQWDLLRATPQLKRKAFEEALRWDSTVQTFFRTTSAAVELGGVPLPEGSKILLFLGAANRDPRRWEDPERFDINRQISGHVGFGFGIHQCVGQMLARQEAEVILDALIRKVARIVPAGERQRRLNNTLHALASLPVTFEAA